MDHSYSSARINSKTRTPSDKYVTGRRQANVTVTATLYITSIDWKVLVGNHCSRPDSVPTPVGATEIFGWTKDGGRIVLQTEPGQTGLCMGDEGIAERGTIDKNVINHYMSMDRAAQRLVV